MFPSLVVEGRYITEFCRGLTTCFQDEKQTTSRTSDPQNINNERVNENSGLLARV